MKYVLVLLATLMLGGCVVVLTPQPTEVPQKVCVDATATHYIDCTTGKLIADDAYVR